MKNDYISIELISKIIFESIEEHNNISTSDLHLDKSLDSILHGKDSNLDSLGLINLLVDIESRIQENIDEKLIILDENLLFEYDGPYKSVKSLSEYIFGKVKCQ